MKIQIRVAAPFGSASKVHQSYQCQPVEMSDDQDCNVREASSLIVVSPEPRKKPTSWNPNAYSMEVEDKPPENLMNYKLLMTKRSNKSSFLASAYVFPGGHVDLHDFRLDNWINFYARFNLLPYIEKLCQRSQQLDKPRILTKPLILGSNKLEDYLKPDIAFRLCAIRETFEETGILIMFNGEFIADYRFELGEFYSLSFGFHFRLQPFGHMFGRSPAPDRMVFSGASVIMGAKRKPTSH